MADSRNVILLVRPQTDVRIPGVIELIISPLREFETAVYPTTGQESTDVQRLPRLKNKVKKNIVNTGAVLIGICCEY
jgi:hypothetical protein